MCSLCFGPRIFFFDFFLLFIIHDCVRGWKKNAPSNRLCYYYYSLCTQGWLPGSSPSYTFMQRVYAYILLYYYRYTICEPPPVATRFLLLGIPMLTFSTTDGTTFISIAIKAAGISHREHDFKIHPQYLFVIHYYYVSMSNGSNVTYILHTCF